MRQNVVIFSANERDGTNPGRRKKLVGRAGRSTISPWLQAIMIKIDGRGIRINGNEVASDQRSNACFPQAWVIKHF